MRRRTKKPHQVAAFPIIALLLVGCAGAPPVGQPVKHDASASARTSPFASVARYLASRSGLVTAALYDARTKRTWVLHPGILQDTASIVKVQIMGTALREAEAAGRPLPAAESALMLTMIENSDNNSATMLLADVGGPSAVHRFDRQAGLNDTTPSTMALIPGTNLPGWGLTTTTALDEVMLVARFAYPNSVLTTADREYGLNLMEHVEGDQNWGVSGGGAGVLPVGTTIALKNGWLPLANAGWQVNSIGWISGHGRDYVLAVLTNHNPSEAYGIATIDTIASTVFAELGS